jgi:hypothetical protein
MDIKDVLVKIDKGEKLKQAYEDSRNDYFEHLDTQWSAWVPILMEKRLKRKTCGIPTGSNGVYEMQLKALFDRAMYKGKNASKYNPNSCNDILTRTYECYNTARNIWKGYKETGEVKRGDEAHSKLICELAIEKGVDIEDILSQIEVRYVITERQYAVSFEGWLLKKHKEEYGCLPEWNAQ